MQKSTNLVNTDLATQSISTAPASSSTAPLLCPSTSLQSFATSSTALPTTPVAVSASSSVLSPSASSSTTLPVSVIACQPVDEAQQAVDKVHRIGLPVYSSRVAHALDSGNIIIELDKCIEETAYHILRHGDMNTKSDFAVFGRKMYETYPCIQFNSRLGDSTPWVRLCTVHHCVITHIDLD